MLRIPKLTAKAFLDEITKEINDEDILEIEYRDDLSFEHYIQLADFIQKNNIIKKIAIKRTSINAECLKVLAKSIINHTTVNELIIESPKILTNSGLGIAPIAQLIRMNSHLKKLGLINCRINHHDAKILANAIRKNKTLKEFDLSMNAIGTEAATTIIEALNIEQTVTYLDFWNVGLDDDLERFSIALGNNHSLTRLILNRNKIGDQGAIYLANYLKNNTTLKYLTLDNASQQISIQGRALFEKVFKKNYWMDKLTATGLCLTRTPAERALQIERESPIKDLTGCELAKTKLDEIVISEKNDILQSYLNHFEDVSENYQISYEDFYQMLKVIASSHQDEKSHILNHPSIKLFLKQPYFFAVFIKLDNMSLINKDDFKKFYLLSDDDFVSLHDLLNHEDNTALSSHQMKCLNTLLSRGKPLLISLVNKLIDNIPFFKNDLLNLFSLSSTNIERLHDLVINLFNAKMLTYDTYQKALTRITIKLPKSMESMAVKGSRKNNPEQTRSQITINGSLTLFLQHKSNKKYPKGGYGKIKKGYSTEFTHVPTWNIKKLVREKNGEKYAKRNITYNHLLGRESYYFKSNNLYTIVSTWQHGKSLYDYQLDELKNIPIRKRFNAIVSGLLDIEKFHAIYHIHGDIKSENLIFDSTTITLSLIDFDSSRKKGSHNPAPFTAAMLDTHELTNDEQSFNDDVYAMGKTIIELFPELYDEDDDCLKNENEMLPIEYAIVTLISAMTHRNRDERCTNISAIDFCQIIINHSDDLTKDLVKTAAEGTIWKNEISIEDILRNRLTP